MTSEINLSPLLSDVNGVKVVCILCQTVYVYKPSSDKALTSATLSTIVTTGGGGTTLPQSQLSLLKPIPDGKSAKQKESIPTIANVSNFIFVFLSSINLSYQNCVHSSFSYS
jgi:hypothetical protein